MVKECRMQVEMRNAYNISVLKSEGKRPYVRRQYTLEVGLT
jgi:hypothetical protein